LAIEISDDAGAVDIELDDLEMAADIGFDMLLREIDEMGILAIRTAALLPYHGELFAARGRALEVVLKLKKAIDKPVLAVESVVGHDGRRPCRARGQG